MNPATFSIIEMCGIVGVAFCLVGLTTLLVAVRKARPEFRGKGYLRTPSGTRWFRFLLYKQYESFENPSTRFFFGITHFCMLGMFIVLMAVAALVGSEYLLKGVNGLPTGGWIK
jgi:hypothetical protein